MPQWEIPKPTGEKPPWDPIAETGDEYADDVSRDCVSSGREAKA
jgi:hypothetical protein